MELFKNTRLKIGITFLEKKLTGTKRKVHYSNISSVRKIGIVWDASRTDEFASLTKFFHKMSDRNIEVRILGYFPGTNLPDQYTAIRYLSCLRRNEINFFYQPVSSESTAFINNHFDILIDINFRKLFPLYYITCLSKAGFKVGLAESETGNSPFDLMMEIKAPVNIDNYLNQTLQYLEMIKADTAK
jgi:hypothetical protein